MFGCLRTFPRHFYQLFCRQEEFTYHLMSHSGPFSRCVVCDRKLPYHGEHNHCLYCLGEAHLTQNCKHCEAFTKAALRARQQRLRYHLWDSTLSSSKPSSMELPSTVTTSCAECSSPQLPATMASGKEKPAKKTAAAKKMSTSKGTASKPAKQAKAKDSVKTKETLKTLPPVSASVPSPLL